MVPNDLSARQTFHHVFREWQRYYTREKINGLLRVKVRTSVDKKRQPTVAIADSQRESLETDPHGGEAGYALGKRRKGRSGICLLIP